MKLTEGSRRPAATVHARLQAIAQAAQRLPHQVLVAIQLILAVGLVVALWRYATAEHDDVLIYLDAARQLATGGPLYRDIIYWREIGYWMGVPAPQPFGHGPYVYPPPLAIAILPLLALPSEVAEQAWYLIGFLAVLLTSLVLARLLIGRSLLAFLIVTTLLIYFQPIRRNLSLAQADTVTLGFVALALGAFISRRDTRTGLALAGAISVKPFVGFIVLFLIWKRAYRSAIVAVLASAVLVGGTLLVLGPDTIRDYVVGTSYWTSPQSAATIANQAPSGLLLRAFTSLNGPARIAELPWLVLPLRLALTLLTIGLLAYAVSRERTLPTPTLVTEYGLSLVAMVFISPHGEDLHLVYGSIMLIAGAVVVYRSQPLDRALLLAGVALVALALVYLFPMHRLLTWDAPFYELCATLLVGTLLVFAEARRRRQIRRRERQA